MKRILIAFLIFVVLCSASAAFFVVVTQKGVFADEMHLYASLEKSKEVTTTEQQLETALKSTEKLTEKPSDMNEVLYLETNFILGISMDYRIFFNPITGESCIEKGLVNDRYYILDSNFIASLKTGRYTIADINKMQAAMLEEDTYTSFRDNLTKTDKLLTELETKNTYSLNAFLPNGNTLEYVIYADFGANRYYVETPYGLFISKPENMSGILSSDPVFTELAEETQPIPELVLKADFNLVPYSISVDWNRTKPDGDTGNLRYTDSFTHTVEMPDPGTLLSLTYADGRKIEDDIHLTLIEFRDGEEYISHDMQKENVYIPHFEGLLDYTLKAEFNNGTLKYDYEIQMDIPALAQCPYPEVRPGNTLAFYVEFADEGEEFSLESNIGNFSTKLVPYGDALLGLVPINWWTVPGNYNVEIYKTANDEKSIFTDFDITVLKDDFEVTYQQLVVSDELKEKTDPVKTANDGVMIAAAKSDSNETSYLDGTFILPLNGAFGTSYAQTRYINGANPYRHSGLDIDGDTGDPIVAGNSGVVVMAAELVRTGNTIIIDHGMWLFSSYLHMSAFDVKVGDFVEKGDLIGKVGSTGFSTGPHLHWSITLNGNYMSPLWLVENPVVPQ